MDEMHRSVGLIDSTTAGICGEFAIEQVVAVFGILRYAEWQYHTHQISHTVCVPAEVLG